MPAHRLHPREMVRFERHDDTDGNTTEFDDDPTPMATTFEPLTPWLEADEDVGVDDIIPQEDNWSHEGRWSPIEAGTTSALAVNPGLGRGPEL